MQVTDAYNNGELSSFYRRPSSSQTFAYADDIVAPAIPRPDLPSSSRASDHDVPYVIYGAGVVYNGASMEVFPGTPPSPRAVDEPAMELDISSSEPSGQHLSSDELFDTTPDLSQSSLSEHAESSGTNSPIIARRLNISLASSSSSTTSEEVINEHVNFMDHSAYQR